MNSENEKEVPVEIQDMIQKIYQNITGAYHYSDVFFFEGCPDPILFQKIHNDLCNMRILISKYIE